MSHDRPRSAPGSVARRRTGHGRNPVSSEHFHGLRPSSGLWCRWPCGALAITDCQPFFAVESVDAVDPGRLALTAQKHEKPPIPEPAAFIGQVAQSAPLRRRRRPRRLVADGLPIRPGNLVRPPLRHPEQGLQMHDCLALHDRRHNTFDKSYLIAAMSSICSAISRFNLTFSCSSAFSRLASDTVVPKYFAFQV